MEISGAAAFVTGGAQGIGRAVCDILLQHGAKVCFADIDTDTGGATLQALKTKYPESDVIFAPCDTTSHESFKDAFEKAKTTFGQIDIHVNNAGILAESQWRKTVQINLIAVIDGTYMALEHMGKDKGGKGGVIINMASVASFGPCPLVPVYGCTKAAVVSFSSSWADEIHYSKHGVRINCICPGPADTVLQVKGENDNCDPELWQVMKEIPKITATRVAEGVLELIKSGNGKNLVITADGATYHDVTRVMTY